MGRCQAARDFLRRASSSSATASICSIVPGRLQLISTTLPSREHACIACQLVAFFSSIRQA